jgi:hypothetical protein
MVMTKGKNARERKAGRYVWRDATGQFQGILISDPAVKPKSATVHQIKRAIEKTFRLKTGSLTLDKLK